MAGASDGTSRQPPASFSRHHQIEVSLPPPPLTSYNPWSVKRGVVTLMPGVEGDRMKWDRLDGVMRWNGAHFIEKMTMLRCSGE